VPSSLLSLLSNFGEKGLTQPTIKKEKKNNISAFLLIEPPF